MSDPKIHHFVPQSHLVRWSIKDYYSESSNDRMRKVFYFEKVFSNRKSRSFVFNYDIKHVGSIMCVDHLYSLSYKQMFDPSIEVKLFGAIDREYAKSVNLALKFIDDGNPSQFDIIEFFNANPTIRIGIASFFVSSIYRNIDYFYFDKDVNEYNLLRDIVYFLEKESNGFIPYNIYLSDYVVDRINARDYLYIKGNIRLLSVALELIRLIMNDANDISKMYFCVIKVPFELRCKEEFTFLTGDSPSSMYRTTSRKTDWYYESMHFMPISPFHCLTIVSNELMYNGNDISKKIYDGCISSINSSLIKRSKRIVGFKGAQSMLRFSDVLIKKKL